MQGNKIPIQTRMPYQIGCFCAGLQRGALLSFATYNIFGLPPTWVHSKYPWQSTLYHLAYTTLAVALTAFLERTTSSCTTAGKAANSRSQSTYAGLQIPRPRIYKQLPVSTSTTF